jgi:hypothetical protein
LPHLLVDEVGMHVDVSTVVDVAMVMHGGTVMIV